MIGIRLEEGENIDAQTTVILDPSDSVFMNADAGVRDLDGQGSAIVRTHTVRNLERDVTLVREFHRVAQQIEHHLAEAAACGGRWKPLCANT